MQENSKTHPVLNYIPAEILCARDYEVLAKEFIAFDRLAYISGGSGHDVTLKENANVFLDYAMVPRTLRDLNLGHTQIQLMGHQLKHPIILGPVAYQKLIHSDGEIATVEAAKATDTNMVVSTLSSVTLEKISAQVTNQSLKDEVSQLWFQLYLQSNEEETFKLVQRAVHAGYKAIVLTIDASIQQPSIRALRAKFSFPADLKAANLVSQTPQKRLQTPDHQNQIFNQYMQTAPTEERIKNVIRISSIPVWIKGVMSDEDAVLYKALGAAGIIVSNHGGRTLDGVPASLSVLPKIRHAVGSEYPLLFDSGIRSGSDVFKAIALGADAVLIGRLQLYALSVAGALGVAHMIKLLREELELCMAMTGCKTIDDIKATELHRKMEN